MEVEERILKLTAELMTRIDTKEGLQEHCKQKSGMEGPHLAVRSLGHNYESTSKALS